MADVTVPPSDLYTVSRLQIQSYDAGLGVRLLWLINGQAFAFGIYSGLTFAMPPTPYFLQKAIMFGGIIPLIGAVVTLFTLFDIITTIVQIRKLRLNYKATIPAETENALPLLDASTPDRFFQRFAPVASTIFFLMLWTFVILYDHHMIK